MASWSSLDGTCTHLHKKGERSRSEFLLPLLVRPLDLVLAAPVHSSSAATAAAAVQVTEQEDKADTHAASRVRSPRKEAYLPESVAKWCRKAGRGGNVRTAELRSRTRDATCTLIQCRRVFPCL